MAEPYTVKQLRDLLSDPSSSAADAFSILKSISALVNANGDEEIGREMVLRALDQRPFFAACDQILESLTRAVGLFPYMNSDDMSVRDALAYELHRPLDMSEDFVFHREQAYVYRRLIAGDSVILSAPTSFGKSKIIDAIVARNNLDNIAIIVPTIALIDETRRRLAAFSDRYKIVTHLSQRPASRNLFVFTAERIVEYPDLPTINFFVIDEFYKIDPGDQGDPRAVALSRAFYQLWKGKGQFYLLGPNIASITENAETSLGCYFYKTSFATVVSDQNRIRDIDNDLDRLVELTQDLTEQTLIFCSSPLRVNLVAQTLTARGVGVASPALQPCADWAGQHYHREWTFCLALSRGIGIHHGRLPRALAQYMVRMFNEGDIRFLVCTSTLIQGVNTNAKNVIIFDNTIATRRLDYFTFSNIKGRSGRMREHLIGNVYLFHSPPPAFLPRVEFPTLTQSATTPSSLLVQMDDADLLPESRERVREYFEEAVLPLSFVRQNSGVDPARQVELAKFLEANAAALSSSLTWTASPNSSQLGIACELIWEYLVRQGQMHGVTSSDQLAARIFRLMYEPRPSVRIREELTGDHAADTVDEGVERILQFDRNWASFEFPRLLMALSRIQGYVLERAGVPFGNYEAFASRVECLFTTPIVAALDEYGIPIQLGRRLRTVLGGIDNLDDALAVIADLDTARLERSSDFERDLIRYAQQGLRA